jgi:hypothetical protein
MFNSLHDAKICFARATAFEAVEFRGRAFAPLAGLAGVQKSDQFFSPYQEGPLILVRLQAIL